MLVEAPCGANPLRMLSPSPSAAAGRFSQDAVESGDYWKLQAAARSRSRFPDCNERTARRKLRQCKLQLAVVWAQSRPDRSPVCDLSFVLPPGTPAEASDAYSQSPLRGAWLNQGSVQACLAVAWQRGELQASRELRRAAQVRIPVSCTPYPGLGIASRSLASKSGSGRELQACRPRYPGLKDPIAKA